MPWLAQLLGAFDPRHQPLHDRSEQLAWTGIDRFENGDPRRLRKLEKSRPIDVPVALALAVWRVVLGASRSLYESRGVMAISAKPEEPTFHYVDGEPVPLAQ